MLNDLKQKKVKYGARKGQTWFTKEVRQLWREFHRAESEWLRCVDQVKRRGTRLKYVKRRVYKRAVLKAKALFEERSCGELEKVVNNPKKWWKLVQKMKMVNKRGDKVDVTKVYDKDRYLRTGSEAVKLWKKHFEEVLNGELSPDPAGVGEEATSADKIGDHSGSQDEDFTRKEVRQALRGLKAKSAPGRDGLTVE